MRISIRRVGMARDCGPEPEEGGGIDGSSVQRRPQSKFRRHRGWCKARSLPFIRWIDKEDILRNDEYNGMYNIESELTMVTAKTPPSRIGRNMRPETPALKP